MTEPTFEERCRFVAEWFGEGPRSLATPEQRQIESPDTIFPYLNQSEQPVWLSVSQYYPDKTVWTTDRLFFDFDSLNLDDAWRDASTFAENVWRWFDIKPFISFSGKKGFHVYFFTQKSFGEGLPDLRKKAIYSELQRMLIGNSSYPTLDKAVLGDFKRVARIPYSFHEKSKSLVTPLDCNCEPIHLEAGFLDQFRRCGVPPHVVRIAERRVEEAELERLRSRSVWKTRRGYRDSKKLRPCMEAVANSSSTHSPHHKLKVAFVAEAFTCGWSESEIIGVFALMAGYNERITALQVRSIKGRKPFRCSTIRELGGCLNDCPLKRTFLSSKMGGLN